MPKILSASLKNRKNRSALGLSTSGVARVPCALEQGIILRTPCQQKLQSLKWKIGEKCGRSKNRTFTV